MTKSAALLDVSQQKTAERVPQPVPGHLVCEGPGATSAGSKLIATSSVPAPLVVVLVPEELPV